MTDPSDALEIGCFLAFRLMLRPSTTLTGNLEITDGYYGFSDQAREYHPLEAILVSEDATTGELKVDAAAKLGVSAEWVEGFSDGFALAREASDDPDYKQGYLAAEELRQRRPGLFKMYDGPDAEGMKG